MPRASIIVLILSLIVILLRWTDLNSDLLDAARQGNTATVESLLRQGADVNATDDHGVTALMYAVVNGHTSTVRALIDAGADVNKALNSGKSTLISAAAEDHSGVVDLIVQAGATQ